MFDLFKKLTFSNKQKKIKVSVVGNCQSRPIANFLSILNEQIEVNCIAVVHLLKSEEVTQYEKYFKEADFIIAQLVADNYPCDFVRTNVLKSTYGSKVISIINLFYKGYNPELMYMRNTSHGTLKSPLVEYHNEIFLESWKEGLDVNKTIQRYKDKDYNLDRYSEVATNSLKELESRENTANVTITDFIKKNLTHQKLFFVFNHPNNFLIIEMAKRIIKAMDLNITHGKDIQNTPEALNKIEIPTNVSTNYDYDDIEYFKGVECTVNEKNIVETGKTKIYTLEEIVLKYFEVYDNVLERGIDK